MQAGAVATVRRHVTLCQSRPAEGGWSKPAACKDCIAVGNGLAMWATQDRAWHRVLHIAAAPCCHPVALLSTGGTRGDTGGVCWQQLRRPAGRSSGWTVCHAHAASRGQRGLGEWQRSAGGQEGAQARRHGGFRLPLPECRSREIKCYPTRGLGRTSLTAGARHSFSTRIRGRACAAAAV